MKEILIGALESFIAFMVIILMICVGVGIYQFDKWTKEQVAQEVNQVQTANVVYADPPVSSYKPAPYKEHEARQIYMDNKWQKYWPSCDCPWCEYCKKIESRSTWMSAPKDKPEPQHIELIIKLEDKRAEGILRPIYIQDSIYWDNNLNINPCEVKQ